MTIVRKIRELWSHLLTVNHPNKTILLFVRTFPVKGANKLHTYHLILYRALRVKFEDPAKAPRSATLKPETFGSQPFASGMGV